MLEVFRKKENQKYVLVLFGIIALAFIFMVSGGGGGLKNNVAVVDGVEIGLREYQNALRRQIEYTRQRMGENYSEEALKQLGLESQVKYQLINNILIINEAERQGLSATKNELMDYISKESQFLVEGAFSQENYYSWLDARGIKPLDYETEVKNQISMEKMVERTTSAVKVTEEDAWQEYAKENKLITFEYLTVDPAKFEDGLEVTDEQLKKYYDEKGYGFTVPTRVKVVYALGSFDEMAGKVELNEEAVKAYYEDNKEEYFVEGSVRASHILISAGDDPEAAKTKAEGVLVMLETGADFAELAKTHSADPGSATKGGDLGFFKKGRMVKPFEEAAFSLEIGQTSELVETQFGYHIIKTTGRKEDSYLPLDEVRSKVEAKLRAVEGRVLTGAKAEELLSVFETTDDIGELEKAAKEAGFKAEVTGLFSEEDRTNPVVTDEMARFTAFGLTAGSISGVIETEDSVILLKVLERVEEHVPPIEKLAGKIKEGVIKEGALELAREEADTLLAKLTDGAALAEVAKEAKLEVSLTRPTSHAQGIISEMMLFTRAHADLFALNAEKPLYDTVVEQSGKFYIFTFKSFEEAKRDGFEPRKAQMIDNLRNVRENEALLEWLEDLRAKAEIKISNQEL